MNIFYIFDFPKKYKILINILIFFSKNDKIQNEVGKPFEEKLGETGPKYKLSFL